MQAEVNQIGKYHVRGVIGRGGMGVVYAGHDPDIDRPVAIKTVLPHLLTDEDARDFLTRFQREARAAARCLHPNIVAVLEYGQHEDAPYIVMEHVDGKPLELLLREPMSPKRGLQVFSDLLKALHAAHGAGIIHRDIKPANVLVLADGHAKLADFGIAHLTMSTGLTQAGMVVGTPRFMAPEQAAGLQVDHRADLFSVTLIALDLLQRARWSRDIPTASAEIPPSVQAAVQLNRQATIPASFVELIRKGLAPDPDRRYQSARELMTALKLAVDGLRAGSLNAKEQVTARQPPDPDPGAFTSFESTTPTPFESTATQTGTVSGLSQDLLLSIKEDFAAHLKGDAHKVLAAQLASSISYAEFILALADHIPRKRARTRFTNRWLEG